MDVDELGQHISRSFNDDLESVRNSVLSMGGLVEQQFDRAIEMVLQDFVFVITDLIMICLLRCPFTRSVEVILTPKQMHSYFVRIGIADHRMLGQEGAVLIAANVTIKNLRHLATALTIELR